MNKITIGCDIGGVIRNSIDSTPINQAIDSIFELSKNYEIIFISKCKDAYQLNCRNWMKENGLGGFKIIFCYEPSEKVKIAAENNISIMIDDKIQVLSKFDDDTLKIWLCNDEKKINGTKSYQPDLFKALKLATNWPQLIEIIRENS
jgi:uncharacterized HAD superfamily protein